LPLFKTARRSAKQGKAVLPAPAKPESGRKRGMMNREMPRVLRRVIFAGLLALAGCAGRPEGVLVPSGEAPAGVSTVDLLVATTRAPSHQPGVLFSGERGSELVMRDIRVSIPPDDKRKVGQVQWPEKLPANPQKDFSTVSVTPVDSAQKSRATCRRAGACSSSYTASTIAMRMPFIASRRSCTIRRPMPRP
jgi:hypothetical protein